MWIAKDEDGEIYAYSLKPEKSDHVWIYETCGCMKIKEEDLPEELRNISWNDEEPTEVNITFTRKVV